jgi:sugar/nucleoside kinase (ribokinase family)
VHIGVGVRLWSRVGDDFPATWRDALTHDGVDLGHLDVVKGGRTPMCTILTDLLDRQCFAMDQGAMASMVDHPPQPTLLDGLAPSGWLHLATGDPLAYAPIAAEAKERGLQVALDPGQELSFQYDARSFEGLLDLSDALWLNEHELRVACDYLSYGAPEQLLDHVDTVLVTRAEKGATLYRAKGKPVQVAAFPVPRVVDPTGAGDAARAGWYAALAEGRPVDAALKWAMAAASLIIEHPGSQDHVVRRGELDRRVAQPF